MENLLPRGMLGTPRRTVVAGVAALVLATILLFAYLSHYRSSVKSASASVSVLRSKAFIPKGTTALSLAKQGLFEFTAVPKEQLKEGAITDAAVIQGQVALNDIYPAQQLTLADFGVTAVSSALSGSADLLGSGKSTGTYRALAMALDTVHGLSPQVQTGDHVDMYVNVGDRVGLFKPNVLILQAPTQVAAGTTAPTSGNYILRVSTKDVPRFELAADTGGVWFALRPQAKAKPAPAGFATADSLLRDR
jgi:Flp pilus assembly protein CpaB